ncbi:MAG: RagB/SusD family nutrient uptake outer membrane protein [Prevotella bivia]|nr:RagB/SusD family nutrient uptake outer membrane protein [Prevotella bivia]
MGGNCWLPSHFVFDSRSPVEAKGDWGAYSHNQLLTDKTLYNIRRERRNELIGEGLRMDDLKRWRSLDQVKNYVIMGARYW